VSKPLRLSLKRVKCQDSQPGEWGKDEMYLVGYGITGRGHSIMIRPASLGSYGTGDVSDQGWTLVDTQVSDDDNSAAFCIWLFEHDSGHLKDKGAELENDFAREYANGLVSTQASGLPDQSRTFYAFAQAMVNMSLHMMDYASEGLGGFANADDLLTPKFHNVLAEQLPPPAGIYTFELDFQSPDLSPPTYRLYFEYSFRVGEPVIHP
jgi:hypothetical protein